MYMVNVFLVICFSLQRHPGQETTYCFTSLMFDVVSLHVHGLYSERLVADRLRRQVLILLRSINSYGKCGCAISIS